MHHRTKIICTIGPSVCAPNMLKELILSGMDVARLNFSHGTHEEHLEVINTLKSLRDELERPLAIMLDTKGPEIRLGKLEGGQLSLSTGDHWFLSKEVLVGNAKKVTITPGVVLERLTKGKKILFDDGYIVSKVIEVSDEGVLVEIENGGLIKSGKGVNIPNESLNLPFFTDKDLEDIRFGVENEIDIIAASFVRSADHVIAIKEILDTEGKSDILVVAKIESFEGVQNFDAIIQVADGIMIARGDLGVELPLTQVPRLQKQMIRKACLAGKPSVTATQMLESMIQSPRPTRAETSDVANAIYDSTSAVMLSGETAVGQYPIEAVQMMQKIVEETEKDLPYREFFDQHSHFVYHDVPSAVTRTTVNTAYDINAKAIFAFTSSGRTIWLLARFRPRMPIVAMTPNKKCYHQLAFSWGAIPHFSSEPNSVEEAFEKLSAFAIDKKIVTYGDLVVETAGSPFGVPKTTNTVIVESIGEVLVRGFVGTGQKVHGNVVFALSSESKEPYTVRDKILVITRCDHAYLPLIREASGVILQNHIDDRKSETYLLKVAKELSKPAIIRADGACTVLNKSQLVTLDPNKSLVYKGVVF